MRKSLAVIAARYLAIAFTLSVSFSSAVEAMPAPTPGNIELSIGLAQWGAETEVLPPMSNEEIRETLLGRAQNDKRLKLNGWGEQWWQFWLETPPMMTGPAGGAVFSGRQRFGRGGGFRK